MAPVFPTGYIRLVIDLTAGTDDEFFSVHRSTAGPITADNPGTSIAENLRTLQGRAVFIDDSVPIGVDVWYQVTGSDGGVINSGPIQQTTGIGFMWLKDTLRPWADIPFDTCDTTQGHAASGCELIDPEFVWGGFVGDITQDADAGLFPILNAEHPADVFARRKFARGSLTFFTRTIEAIDTVYDLFTAGGPLLLQLPAEYGWHDTFIQPDDLHRAYIANDQRRPERVWNVDFTVVDQPGGPAQGTACNNWCEINDAFATYADFEAAGDTYSELLQGVTLCPPGVEDGFGIGPFGAGPFGDGG